ncbi:hypothetical protein OA101_00415 [Alphaproteobacteria bacterium]|nr:hypothetical protein [Alphaproteobacteria bacterium]
MYCPDFIFDTAVSFAAEDFISGELSIEIVAKKYSTGLAEKYEHPIVEEVIVQAAEDMLRFLSEIEAADQAAELLKSFAYNRLYLVSIGKPRKLHPMFGLVEDSVKELQYDPAQTVSAFKAFVFGLRSSTVSYAPAGWDMSKDENFPTIAAIYKKQFSIFDAI